MKYIIPKNYMGHSTVLYGRIKLRFLLEGAVMALGAAALQFLIPCSTIQQRAFLLTLFCTPPLMIGCIGFNGDSIFKAIGYIIQWKKRVYPCIADPAPRLLTKRPAEVYDTMPPNLVMKIAESGVNWWTRRNRKKDAVRYEEGVNFEFAENTAVSQYISRADEEKQKAAQKEAAEKAEREQKEIDEAFELDLIDDGKKKK